MTSQAVREQQYRDQRAALQDSRGNWAFDENGYLPVQPGRRVALEAQYATNAYVAQRNRESREAAIGAMRKGMGLLESYRPGGQASLASGMYQGLAEYHYRNQIDAPDQLTLWRDHIRQRAQHRATQARTMQAVAAVVAGVATMGVGLAAGAGLGMAAMGGLSTAAGTMAGGYGAQAGSGSGMTSAFIQGGMQRQTAPTQPGASAMPAAQPGALEQQFLGGPMAGSYAADRAAGGGLISAAPSGQPGSQKRLGSPSSAGGQPGGPQQVGAQQGGQVATQPPGMPGPQGGTGGGLAPEAPESPMTPWGTPATPTAYMAAADVAPQHAQYWEGQLATLPAFFGGLAELLMS